MTKPELIHLATNTVLNWHTAQLDLHPPHLASFAEILMSDRRYYPTLWGDFHTLWCVHHTPSKIQNAHNSRTEPQIIVLHLLFRCIEEVRKKIQLREQNSLSSKKNEVPIFLPAVIPWNHQESEQNVQMRYNIPPSGSHLRIRPPQGPPCGMPSFPHPTSSRASTAVGFVFLCGAWHSAWTRIKQKVIHVAPSSIQSS